MRTGGDGGGARILTKTFEESAENSKNRRGGGRSK